MFHFKRKSRNADNKALVGALSDSLGIIEFDLLGNILTANPNFCSVIGYELSEIKGKHHRMFVRPVEANASEYKSFWDKLAAGQFDAGEYHRVAKGGRDIWIQATYNPVKDSKGIPYKVVKVAADVTAQRQSKIETDGKLAAISRAQAVIEFTSGGDIIDANDNFLATLGYSLNEIVGRNHGMFVEAAYAQSAEYRDFWAQLNRGEFIASEFKRLGKGGKEVWIQATYNPVLDLRGNVTKVVKYATEITGRVRAVQGISVGLTQLADNNLEYRLDQAFDGSFEKLRADYNGSLNVLQSTMQRIANNAISIQSGATEIASASDELSRRTEQQAANLEQTAAALDGITVTVKKSAENATHARTVVGSANDHAVRSASTVRKAITAMETIAKSSQQINQIIGVMDEIAFQTNLLALNAGVEAARAGEAGRGFAVVASEVRALAQRSAEAAKEIKTLLSASSAQVEEGVKLVVETGSSLEQILVQVTEIKQVVVDIAGGAQEQANGLAEINTAIGQLDQVTQQNAAMSEEATAASQTLSGQAVELGNLVGGFRVGGSATPMIRESRPKSPMRSTFVPRVAVARAPARLVANGNAQSDAVGWDEF